MQQELLAVKMQLAAVLVSVQIIHKASINDDGWTAALSWRQSVLQPERLSVHSATEEPYSLSLLSSQ